jgi:hypothetical protein
MSSAISSIELVFFSWFQAALFKRVQEQPLAAVRIKVYELDCSFPCNRRPFDSNVGVRR